MDAAKQIETTKKAAGAQSQVLYETPCALSVAPLCPPHQERKESYNLSPSACVCVIQSRALQGVHYYRHFCVSMDEV